MLFHVLHTKNDFCCIMEMIHRISFVGVYCFQARRALRALRGLVRLKSLVEGSTVKRQTTNTLRFMQGISRVQSQINSRRIRMSEENQALQRQLLQKHAKELESLQVNFLNSTFLKICRASWSEIYTFALWCLLTYISILVMQLRFCQTPLFHKNAFACGAGQVYLMLIYLNMSFVKCAQVIINVESVPCNRMFEKALTFRLKDQVSHMIMLESVSSIKYPIQKIFISGMIALIHYRKFLQILILLL